MPPEDQAARLFQADRQYRALLWPQKVRPFPPTLGSPSIRGHQARREFLSTLADLVLQGYPALLCRPLSLEHPFPLSLPSGQAHQMFLGVLCPLLVLLDQGDLKYKIDCNQQTLKNIFGPKEYSQPYIPHPVKW